MAALMQDFRFAIRALSRSRSFALTVVGILAVGIGAATTVFSVVHAVVLDPIPFPDAGRLVALRIRDENRQAVYDQLAFQDFEDIRMQSRSFEEVAAVLRWSGILSGGDSGRPPERLLGFQASERFFQTLGVRAILGRLFEQGEFAEGEDAVALLGHHLWQTRFGGNRGIVGRSILVDGLPRVIVGVLPRGFTIDLPVSGNDLWLPLGKHHWLAQNRAITSFETYGRLKKGCSIEQARAELATLADNLQRTYPETNKGRGLDLQPLADQASAPVRPALTAASGAVGLLLLLVCVNLANLMLARASTRRREMAVRSALGAGRIRLLRLLLSESLLLALAGGALGTTASAAILGGLPAWLPDDFPVRQNIGVDLWMLGAAVLLTGFTGVVFGCAPAFAGRVKPLLALRQRTGISSMPLRLRHILATAQLALSLVLLLGAGLLGRSFSSLMNVDPGFRTRGVLSFRVVLPPDHYPNRGTIAAFVEWLRGELSDLPGVLKAAAVNGVPLTGHNVGSSLTVEERPQPLSDAPTVGWQVVSPGYFDVMGIPLLAGRDFRPADLRSGSHLVIVNRTLADTNFPDGAVGKRIQLGVPQGDWHEIIGVVGDTRHLTLQGEPDARAYDLLGQHAERDLAVVVHTNGDPVVSAGPVRDRVQAIDPDIPIYDMATAAEVREASIYARRLITGLMMAFAASALFLAAVGVFAVLSFAVERRRGEMAVRLALGACPRRILRLVVGEGMALAAVGAAAGLGGGTALARLLRGLLYGVGSADLPTVLVATLFLAAAALAASAIPARRASRTDPQKVLRAD